MVGVGVTGRSVERDVTGVLEKVERKVDSVVVDTALSL